MSTMLERMTEATNAHDPARLAALFAEDDQSVQPLHPGRGFGGSAQVQANWTSVFEGVPDFASTLVASAVVGQTEWAEWDWTGHHLDGSPFAMRGVIIAVVRDGRVASMRLFMEPVERDGGDIDAAVRELYQPPPTGQDQRGESPASGRVASRVPGSSTGRPSTASRSVARVVEPPTPGRSSLCSVAWSRAAGKR